MTSASTIGQWVLPPGRLATPPGLLAQETRPDSWEKNHHVIVSWAKELF